MSEAFAPPPGPPPPAKPQVPEGYEAHWNKEYKEWFYVNIYTKKSQWEKPTEPIFPEKDLPPPGPPPKYVNESGEPTISEKNSYPKDGLGINQNNANMATPLQSEEENRARGMFNTSSGLPQQPLPPREQKQKSGFLGKLLGKANNGGLGFSDKASQPPYGQQQSNAYQQPPPYGGQAQPQGYPPQGYPPQGYPPQGYPPQGYPPQGYPPQGYPPQGYPPQGYPPQGYPPQGYPPQGYPPQNYPPQGFPAQGYGGGMPQTKNKKSGGGLGMAGGAALGVGAVGAGLVGGMLLENAIENHDQEIYEQGYQDAQDDDDFGGDDDF